MSIQWSGVKKLISAAIFVTFYGETLPAKMTCIEFFRDQFSPVTEIVFEPF